MHGSDVSIANLNSGSAHLQSKPKFLELHAFLHITSQGSHHHKEWEYHDIYEPSDQIQWALEEIKSDIPYAQATRITRIEIHRSLLHPFWTRTALTRPQKANHRKTEGNLTQFWESVNQVLCKVPEDVSLNSRNAAIRMGKLTPVEASSEEYYRFDWLLPTPFAQKLRDHVIHSDSWKQGKLFAIDMSLLESPVLYKVQPSRAYLNRHPNTVLHDLMQNVLSMPNMGTAITLLGVCPRNEVSIFFALDISRMLRQGARSHEGKLPWNFHSEAHMVVFKPLTVAMIFWNDRASTFARHTPTSPATPPPPPFVPTDAPQPIRPPEPPDSHTVDIVAVKGTPVYDIQIVAALLGVFTKLFVAQAWAVRTTRYSVRYKHVKSAVVGRGRAWVHPRRHDRPSTSSGPGPPERTASIGIHRPASNGR